MTIFIVIMQVASFDAIKQVVFFALNYAHDCFYYNCVGDCFCYSYIGDNFKKKIYIPFSN